jgi:hypothetical protein
MEVFFGQQFWSIRNSLDLIEGDGIVAAVVEASGAGGLMALRNFQFPVVLQICGDADRPEAVAGYFRFDCRQPRATSKFPD